MAKKTPDQPIDDLPDLGGDAAAELDAKAAKAAAKKEIEAGTPKSAGPHFNPKKPFSMIWHHGLKQYYQDGVIFDRGSKLPMK